MILRDEVVEDHPVELGQGNVVTVFEHQVLSRFVRDTIITLQQRDTEGNILSNLLCPFVPLC